MYLAFLCSWQDHMDNISTMYLIGYSSSLLTLLVAVCIMLYFK